MAKVIFDWLVDQDSKGPRYIDECGFTIGLASRNHFSAKGYVPGSAIVKRSIAIAREREDRLVRLEFVIAAEGESKSGGSLEPKAAMKVAGDEGQSLRRKYASERRRARKATAKAQAESRKRKRAATRKAGSSAKSGKRKRATAKRKGTGKG